METFYFILLLLGALCFALKVAGTTIKYDLLALGLLLWILVPLIQTARNM